MRLYGSLALLCLVIGLLAGGMAWHDHQRQDVGSATPARIRVQDLGLEGPPDNRHVTVTEFGFGESYVIRKHGSRWDRVWIPLLPPEGRSGIKVVAEIEQVTSEEELNQVVRRRALTGIITTGHLHPDEQRKFQESYPGVDFSKVMYLEVGRPLPSEARLWLRVSAALGSIFMACLGALLCATAWRRHNDRPPSAQESVRLLVFLVLVLLNGGALGLSFLV
jgi:hypothetical protein